MNFGRFLPCWGQPFQNSYPHYHACLAAGRTVKFRAVIPANPKVIGANTLNFKPNFKCSPLKFSARLIEQEAKLSFG